MDKVRLNFLSMENQELPFPIFRKIVHDTSSPKEADYRTKLPVDNEIDNWSTFDISWTDKQGYVRFECDYTTNPHLTEAYLFYRLNMAAKDATEIEKIIPNDSKYKQVGFVINKDNEGETIIYIYPYFLRSQKKAGFIFEHRFRLNTHANFGRSVQIKSLSLDKSGRPNVFIYRDKESLILDFIKRFKPILDNSFSSVESHLTELPTKELKSKIYLVGQEKTSNSQFMGIKNYGPYEKIQKEGVFVFLFSEKTRSLARDIYLGLTGKLFPGQFSGLKPMFGLSISKENVDHYILPEFDASAIDRFFVAIKEKHKDKSEIIIFPVFPRGTKDNSFKFDSYGYIKQLSLQNNILCQGITEDTFYKKDQLKWSISNIALQTFSKLGGKPWLVSPATKNCIIFGLGSAHEILNEKIVKYVAYTICMDSSGNFKYVKPLSSDDDKQRYLKNLTENIKLTLSNIEPTYQNIVLHIPFKIKKAEIQAITDAITSVKNNESREVIVIRINTKHRFLGFSEHHTRVPYESTLLKLSGNQFLLWAEGLQHGKEVLHKRIADPLLIDFLQPPCADSGIRDCLQDILNLTGANWRGFNSKSQPISILYPSLIASFMREFKRMKPEDELEILHAESEKPWFL